MNVETNKTIFMNESHSNNIVEIDIVSTICINAINNRSLSSITKKHNSYIERIKNETRIMHRMD